MVDDTADRDGPDQLKSVELLLDLMETLAASSQPRGITDIAKQLGTSKARIYRHLRSLKHRGYVRQDPATERYEVGVKLLLLGEMVRDRFDILPVMRPEMIRLRDELGQAVTASTLVDDEVIVIELLQGRSPLELGTRPGTRFDLHASAHGKVALAFGPETVRTALYSGRLRPWTDRTIVDPEILAREVEIVRKQGWATAPEELLVGLNALAAPVFSHRGNYAGAIAVVGSVQFIPAVPSPQQIESLKAAAERASRQLGWRMP